MHLLTDLRSCYDKKNLIVVIIAWGRWLGRFEADIPGAIDSFRNTASKALEAFPEIHPLLPEVVGLLQELPGESSPSL